MDQLERFGFIPNGGRIYYLNRSQPPLFVHMLDRYINATNDTSILERALPLAELELEWWSTNRSISVTSSYTSQTYSMFHYAVNNSAPRPESYLEDYQTATGVNLTEQQRSDLYAELASGAESGKVSTSLGNFIGLWCLLDVARLGLHWPIPQATFGWEQLDGSRFQAQDPQHQEHRSYLLKLASMYVTLVLTYCRELTFDSRGHFQTSLIRSLPATLIKQVPPPKLQVTATWLRTSAPASLISSGTPKNLHSMTTT